MTPNPIGESGKLTGKETKTLSRRFGMHWFRVPAAAPPTCGFRLWPRRPRRNGKEK